MNEAERRPRRRELRPPKPVKDAPFPVWAPLLVMTAVILTGVVLGWGTGSIPMAFIVLYAIAAVLVTLIVEARGLFLTVVSLPLYFVVGVVLLGWISSPTGLGDIGLRALVLNMMYPAVQYFKWMFIPFVLATFVAVVRWRLFKDHTARQVAYQEITRQRQAMAERKNRNQVAMIRRDLPTTEAQ